MGRGRNVAVVALIMLVILVSAGRSVRMSLAEDREEEGLAVTVSVDKQQYKYGERVTVRGMIYNTSTGEPVSVKVSIQIVKDNSVLYRVSTYSSENGTYSDNGYYVSETGVLNISSNASSGGYRGTASTTIFSVSFRDIVDVIQTYIWQTVALLGAIGYFILLLYVARVAEEAIEPPPAETNPDSRLRGTQISRWFERAFPRRVFVGILFILLNVLVFSPIVSLVFTPRPIGSDAPLGLVPSTYGNETQWIINMGGKRVYETSQYVGGVQVPIYVIILSFLGAYVYFLSKVPELIHELEYRKLVDDALAYLVRFFIAPLLAIALYLALWHLEVRGNLVLGVVSFTVGLMIEDVVARLLEFVKGVIGKMEKKEEKVEKQIARLADLQAKGVLTKDEFESKKKELLQKLYLLQASELL